MTRLKDLDPIGLTNCFIAGGAVLSHATKQDISDYDIYPKSKQAALDVCAIILDGDAYILNVSDKAITFKHNKILNDKNERAIFQVVIFQEFPTAQSIFDTFDFTVCMGAFDCDIKKYEFDPMFWEDIASKTLRINKNMRQPLATLVRLSKYREKGYKIGVAESAKLALILENTKLPESWEKLSSQLGGVYGKQVELKSDEEFSLESAINLLEEIDSTYLTYGTEDYSNWTIYDLEVLITGSSGNYYRFNGETYEVSNGWVTPIKVYNNHKLPDLRELPSIKGIKYLKSKGENYIGAVYQGDHNGVTYKSGEETRYEKGQYLFCYQVPEVSNMHKYVSEVEIKTCDIISIGFGKIQTKAMTLGDISDC